jgi:hypothetical protein
MHGQVPIRPLDDGMKRTYRCWHPMREALGQTAMIRLDGLCHGKVLHLQWAMKG